MERSLYVQVAASVSAAVEMPCSKERKEKSQHIPQRLSMLPRSAINSYYQFAVGAVPWRRPNRRQMLGCGVPCVSLFTCHLGPLQ